MFLLMLGCCVVVAACSSTAPIDPTSIPPGTTTVAVPTPIADRYQQLLDHSREAYGAPGAVAVVDIDGERWSGSSGIADLAGTPVGPDARFRIASITKPIVAALVLQAVERGELSLDDPVADIVPGVLRIDPPVTVRMLLDHTSGIYDITNDDDPMSAIGLLEDPSLVQEATDLVEQYEAGEHVVASDRLIVALSEARGRLFAPGTGFQYGNTNYQLAAMVLEAVTGQSLAQLLRDRVVEPLGLRSTSLAPDDPSSPDLRGYGTSVDDGSLVDVTDDLLAFGNGGNGGIMSTATELLRVIQAIVGGEMIDDTSLNEMTTPTSLSAGTYGLGLAVYRLSCGTFYGHEGGVNGTASIALSSSDGTDGVVIALNLRSGADPGLPALADQYLCPHRS